ncbi:MULTISPECIES: OsmC family protein [unclassified Arthrobacter]|uniref:OsmC family protein n=1 Tax=unclassified Arthrobacter TaxID=235627 RepID=UPI002E0BF749|nr:MULTISPECIES: OsmC family protein [unclassified Arthrobacter]MEC5193371.1 putative redox protein [Arthrobacter sp. MP_M4]MEC5204837.1 putative redox protein [Arthrobacter sp. MP_M7]
MSSEPTTTSSNATPAHGPASGSHQPVRVVHLGGDRFDINVRGHAIRTDQPVGDGGEDTGPTPTELFIASLAGCVAFYARRYLDRHDLPTDGLAIEAEFNMGSRPARVARIDVLLTIPAGVPDERREALLAVASHCTVHNTLMAVPEISVAFASDAGQSTANP